MSFVVERILNAQLYSTEEDGRYWVFTVKWFDDKNYSLTLESEFHPVFQNDPLILKRFWNSHGIDPETYILKSLIPATERYIDESKSKQDAPLSRKRKSSKRGEKRVASPLPSSASKRKRKRSRSTSTTTTTITTNNNDDDEDDDEDDKMSYTPIAENSPTVITVPRYAVEPIQIDSDTEHTDADDVQQRLPFEQLSLSNGNRSSNNVKITTTTTTNREITPAWSLPPIAVLNDLPDYEDSDIVETIPTTPVEAPNTEDFPLPASFSSSEADRLEVDDILVVDAAAAEKPEEPESHKTDGDHKQIFKPEEPEPESEIIMISSDEDDDLHAEKPEPEHDCDMQDTSNTNGALPPISIPGGYTTPPPRLQTQQRTMSSPGPVSPAPLNGASRPISRSASLKSPSPSSAISFRPKLSSPLAEQGRKQTSPPIPINRSNSKSNSNSNTSASPALRPSEPNDQIIPKRDYPGFILHLENDSRIPICIRDDRSRVFRDFITPIDDELVLSVHGYYLQDDITKLFENTNHLRFSKTNAFARVYLDPKFKLSSKSIWTSFSDDLFTKKLCLVLFPPDAPDALLVFPSLSKAFGRSVGAPTWSLGIRDFGLVIARVALHKSDLCFKRQFR